jgi:thiol-disulfide isomerase/thioredoxin
MPTEALSNEPVVGRNVYDIDLKPLGQRRGVRLSEFRGKALLVDIWASWCAPCKHELPMLDDAVDRLRARNVEIVAISVDESATDAEEFLQSRPTWSLTFGHAPLRLGIRRLEVSAMPTAYVIDRTGVIREVHPRSDQDDFRAIESRLVELGASQ